jgi:hypothetical protein
MTIPPPDPNRPRVAAWQNSLNTDVIEVFFDELTTRPSEEELRKWREELRKRYGPKPPPPEGPPAPPAPEKK